MSNPGIVWEMNEENSVGLVLFNLRNRTHFLFENFPQGFQDFNPEGTGDFLQQIRKIEEAVEKILEWYYDLNRTID